MSLLPLMFPLQAKVVLENARESMGLSKKEFGARLGFKHESDYSKVLAGIRSGDLNHIMPEADDETQLNVATEWVKALNQRVERDLVADLCGRVERLLDALGRLVPVQAKASLRDDAERKTA